MAPVLRVVMLGENGPEAAGEGDLLRHADQRTQVAEGKLADEGFLVIVGQPEVLQGIKAHLAGLPGVEADTSLVEAAPAEEAPAQAEALPLQEAPAVDVPPTLVEGGPVEVVTGEAAQAALAVEPQPLPEAPAEEAPAADEKPGKASK